MDYSLLLVSISALLVVVVISLAAVLAFINLRDKINDIFIYLLVTGQIAIFLIQMSIVGNAIVLAFGKPALLIDDPATLIAFAWSYPIFILVVMVVTVLVLGLDQAWNIVKAEFVKGKDVESELEHKQGIADGWEPEFVEKQEVSDVSDSLDVPEDDHPVVILESSPDEPDHVVADMGETSDENEEGE